MSFYLMVFQGGGAVGSAIMGLIAERAGLSVALTIAAAGLALSPLAGLVWRAWHDASDPGRVLGEFVVASWDDHLRQHERVTKREQAHLERVRELTDPDHPIVITHWLAVSSRKLPGSPAKPT